jgi:ligand-binding SRPBCC domain-containing protein
MPTYQRRTRIRAPLSTVWEFHSGIEGLTAVTPEWMHLWVEGIRGPDGEGNPDVLFEGTTIDLSIRPFGLGPRQSWTSHITERVEGEGWARFRDEMTDGPFDHWLHTHQFFADGEETVMIDRVEYRLPFGALGDAVGPVSRVGFEPMFRYRHRETRELLEGETEA